MRHHMSAGADGSPESTAAHRGARSASAPLAAGHSSRAAHTVPRTAAAPVAVVSHD